jgi:hypothetical protein
MNKKGTFERILCSICGVNTNHKIVWESEERKDEDEEIGIWETTQFDVLQCLGCETPTLRKKYMFSEDMDIRLVNGENIAFPKITF